MPQTLYTEQGEEKEVLTDEEVEALKGSSSAVIEIMKEVGLEVGENALEKLEELKEKVKELKEAENPNWKSLREKSKSMEKFIATLKAEGKTVNDEGKIVEEKALDIESVKREAITAARQELIEEKLEATLGEIKKEDREVVMHYYNKLTAGEDVNLKNVSKFLNEALELSKVKTETSDAKKSISRIGSSYTPESGDKNFADTDRGKEALKLFGLEEPKKDNK